MARNLSEYQKGIVKRYYEHRETIQSTKLSEIVSDLWLADTSSAKAKLWKRAEQILTRAGVKQSTVRQIVGRRDEKALAKMASQVDAGSAPQEAAEQDAGRSDAAPAAPAPPGDARTVDQLLSQRAADRGYDSLDEENLKRALRAFRKKLKAMKLEDESRLGNRYVTYGRESSITGIQPPNEYPPAVWNRLTEQGRLRKTGQGTFALP